MNIVILDREIFWMRNELRLIERNPTRNFRVKNSGYIPLPAVDEPAVSPDDNDGLYAHYAAQLKFLEEARRGHIVIEHFPLMAPEYLRKAIFSH